MSHVWIVIFVAALSILFAVVFLIAFLIAYCTFLKSDKAHMERLFKRHREMHYLESLVYHVAYREGRVSQARIFELIPEAERCHDCRKQVSLVFKYGLIKRHLLMDVQTQCAYITPHVRRLIESSELFEGLETAWILPARKIIFSHGACHMYAVK